MAIQGWKDLAWGSQPFRDGSQCPPNLTAGPPSSHALSNFGSPAPKIGTTRGFYSLSSLVFPESNARHEAGNTNQCRGQEGLVELEGTSLSDRESQLSSVTLLSCGNTDSLVRSFHEISASGFFYDTLHNFLTSANKSSFRKIYFVGQTKHVCWQEVV